MILLCLCIIIGVVFALFTDSVSVGNHLRAGTLDVTLTRTNLEYSVLNADGELYVTENSERFDFSGYSSYNIFGISSRDMRIAPGAYFDAELELGNNGSVAFDYSVTVKMLGDSNALTDQLKVVVTHPNGTTTEKRLSELDGGLSIATGRMTVRGEVQSFGVRVEFIDDALNNRAQLDTAAFDIIVTAVQATSAN